jgi:ribosomal protein S18 acetylase RimI-like enzyme
MKIRTMQRKDLKELSKLYAKTLGKSEKRAFFAFKFFMDNGILGALLVAEEKGKPIGAVFGVKEKTFTPNAAKIQSLFIAKEWRGRGIGKQLMERCVAAMKKRGMKSISLLVDRKNRIAKRIYKKLGFKYYRTMLIKEY